MKPPISICLSLLVVASVVAGASGQPSATNINPALLYYQAFLVAPDLPQADSDYLWTKEWQGQELPERFGKLMAGYDNEFKLVRLAARSAVPCDWGIDMSQGPAALLPHLARSKAVVQAAKFRALWALQQGRQAEAREDLVAALVLGRNGARDGTLISTLVQIAIEAIDCRTVAELFGQFSPENLQQLLDGFEAAPARRTVAECVATEKAFFLNWMVRRIEALQQANPGDEARIMKGIRELLAGALEAPEGQEQALPDSTWERLAQAAGGTSGGVVKLIHELEPYEQQLAVVLALPHGEYEGRMEQLMAEIQRSPNPLLVLLFPPWE